MTPINIISILIIASLLFIIFIQSKRLKNYKKVLYSPKSLDLLKKIDAAIDERDFKKALQIFELEGEKEINSLFLTVISIVDLIHKMSVRYIGKFGNFHLYHNLLRNTVVFEKRDEQENGTWVTEEYMDRDLFSLYKTTAKKYKFSVQPLTSEEAYKTEEEIPVEDEQV